MSYETHPTTHVLRRTLRERTTARLSANGVTVDVASGLVQAVESADDGRALVRRLVLGRAIPADRALALAAAPDALAALREQLPEPDLRAAMYDRAEEDLCRFLEAKEAPALVPADKRLRLPVQEGPSVLDRCLSRLQRASRVGLGAAISPGLGAVAHPDDRDIVRAIRPGALVAEVVAGVPLEATAARARIADLVAGGRLRTPRRRVEAWWPYAFTAALAAMTSFSLIGRLAVDYAYVARAAASAHAAAQQAAADAAPPPTVPLHPAPPTLPMHPAPAPAPAPAPDASPVAATPGSEAAPGPSAGKTSAAKTSAEKTGKTSASKTSSGTSEDLPRIRSAPDAAAVVAGGGPLAGVWKGAAGDHPLTLRIDRQDGDVLYGTALIADGGDVRSFGVTGDVSGQHVRVASDGDGWTFTGTLGGRRLQGSCRGGPEEDARQCLVVHQ